MALSLKEDAPPDDGGEAMHFSPPGGEGDPGCGLSFFFIIKSQFPLYFFFQICIFQVNISRKKIFEGKKILTHFYGEAP